MVDVVCLGELLIDFVAENTGTPLEHVVRFRRAPGGAPANVACGIVKLGGSAAFVGKVGDDPFGRLLKETLDQVGVDTTHLKTTDLARTTLVFVGVHRDGRKDMCFYRHPGADMLLERSDIDTDWLGRARAFHFGSISLIDPVPREATLEAARVARQCGMLVSFDPNYRARLWRTDEVAREAIAEGLRLADVAKISDEEWQLVTGNEDFDTGARDVLAMGPQLVVVSRGGEGCLAYAAGEQPGTVRARVESPGFEVEMLEATGAGDGFTASLVVDLLAHRAAGRDLGDLDEGQIAAVCRRANATGALTVTRAGAIPGLPMKEEVDHFLADRDGRR